MTAQKRPRINAQRSGSGNGGVDALAQLDLLNKLTNVKIPKNLAALSTAKILHEDICDKEEMAQRVLDFAAK